MSRVFMTLPQKIEAAKLLDLHMVEIDGGFAYAVEWSDARIANMVGTAAAPVRATHVASIRTELKGAFPRKPSPAIATSAGELSLDTIKNTINKAIKSYAREANAEVDQWSKINTEIADRKFAEQNARIAMFEKTIVALAEKISDLAGEVDGKIKTNRIANVRHLSASTAPASCTPTAAAPLGTTATPPDDQSMTEAHARAADAIDRRFVTK